MNFECFNKEILCYLPEKLFEPFKMLDAELLINIEEIRLRVNRPPMIYMSGEDYILTQQGLCPPHDYENYSIDNIIIISTCDIKRCFDKVSRSSAFVFAEDINKGFITLEGGHRVGICGKIISNNGMVKLVREISGLNFRIAREIIGCSDNCVNEIIRNSMDVYNTLIVSPPQCGKTTLLRDITRIISSGCKKIQFEGLKVGLIDERGEIAACVNGIPQNNIGLRTDVLDCCPKAIGMLMLLRSMSPRVIVTDELGDKHDIEAIMQIYNAGVRIVATVHGYDLDDIKTKPYIKDIVESAVFERILVLDTGNKRGQIKRIIKI